MSLQLPIVVNGRSVHESTGVANVYRFATGESLQVPALTDDLVEEVVGQDRFALRDLPLHEIIAFINTVGRNWKSREYSRRRLYIRYLQRLLGYSAEMADLEANWIALVLCSHYRLFDTIAVELGNRAILDQWVPNEEAQVRGFPRGRSLHVLAGNVPMSGVASIVRGLITKNVCVVKPASDDPVTPLMLALSFLDANPRHPVARALSVACWSSEAPPAALDRLLAKVDVACVWGGAGALQWSRTALPPSAEIVPFGPRRSLAIVGEGADVTETARRLAHNICMYDQRACFSVRQVFVQTPVEPLVAALDRALRLYERLLPKGQPPFDDQARFSLNALESSYLGTLQAQGPTDSWAIVVCRPDEIEQHPLGRTVYVHPVATPDQAAAHIDEDVQTVAVAPYELGYRLRDDLARAGAARVVDMGLANVFRVGGTHDAMYPSQRLVRLVSFERPSQEHPKGITMPIDQTAFLEENRFLEFIP